jgi:hypothetical protein
LSLTQPSVQLGDVVGLIGMELGGSASSSTSLNRVPNPVPSVVLIVLAACTVPKLDVHVMSWGFTRST